MRFGIHMGTLRGLGSGSVGMHLLRELPAAGPGHQFRAWIPRAWGERAPVASAAVIAHRVRAGTLAKFWLENVTIRRALSRGVDALFSLGDTSTPGPSVPNLLLVQQAFLAYEAVDWGFVPPPAFKAKLALMERYFRAGLPGVTRFTVQSHDMKTRLAARWTIDPARIEVVPSALGETWERLAGGPARTRPAGPPMICYPASPAPHKNHVSLVPFLRALVARVPDVRLVLTVTETSVPGLVEKASAAGVLQHLEFRGGLGSQALAALVAGATVIVAPSLLESFGLTYFEAMAAGTPVVSVDRAFAREALGSAGRFADPREPEALAEAALPFLQGDVVWKEASAAGRQRYLAVRRTWPEVARSYLAILEQLGRGQVARITPGT